MDSYAKFNLSEGLFWIVLGIFSIALFSFIPKKYHKLCLSAGIILITFGISDFVEIGAGGFLSGQWWLLLWKIIDIVGLILVICWYLRLRLKS